MSKRLRTPTRLQMEATECGAAALAIVLEHFGTYVPLTTLRKECGVSRDGSKASNILKAARTYKLEARGFKKEPEDLRNMPLPLIVHWNFNHFLVVEGFARDRVYLNDPANGPRTVPAEEFDKSFTGVVLSLQPGEGFSPGGRRPRLLPSLLSRLGGSRSGLLYIVLAGLLMVLPGLAIPIFGKVFVDEVLIAGKRDWLLSLLLGLGLTAVLQAALSALQHRYLVKLVMKLSITASARFLWHVLRLPVPFFFARSAGDLAGRVQLNDSIASLLSGQLASVVLDLMLLVFYGGLMLYFDPLLTGIAVVSAGLHLVVLRLAERRRTDLSRVVGLEAGKLDGVTAGGLQMIETIKATGAESDFFGQWAGHHAKLVAAQQALARREQLVLIALEGVSLVCTLLVLGFGAMRVMDGYMSVGTLVAFQSLMGSFLGPIEGLGAFGSQLQELRGNVERLDDVLGYARDPGAPDAQSEDDEVWRRLTGELELREVTFGYLPFAPPLVQELSLRVAPGQRVALVGGTGSGKSTVAKLVMGLYQPDSGEILFDGEQRAQLPRSALVSSLAMVDQDVTLFEGSVRENLTLWDETISEADVVQAAKDACIHEDIARLSGGYDAQVSEGGYNFSGGQRQRLEIARALVRQPAFVVLDEATSALDPETERRVDENLRRRGCACLIIAHRLSTIRDCDEIIVLEAGRAVQRGSHEQLMSEAGLYRELIMAG